MEKMNHILVCVDEISTQSHGSKLSEKFFDSVVKQTEVVKQYLGIESSKLTVYWSILLNLTIMNSSSDLDDISRFLNSSMIKILSIVPDFEELVRLKLLRKDRSSDRRRRRNMELNSLKYFVPTDIILSLTKGEMTLPKRKKENISQWEIMDTVSNLIKNDLSNEMIDYEGVCTEVEYLLKENIETPFVKKIRSFNLPILEVIILLFSSSEYVLGEQTVDLPRFLRTLYEETGKQLKVRKEFIENKTRLQKLDLIDLVSENFKNDSEIRLTENGSNVMFEDDKTFFVQNSKTVQKDMILSTSIIEQKLFYNEKEQQSIDFLTDLLRPDNYTSVVNRMKDLGMKPGFTVLFHGQPGTGKTESVLQISKMTGRNIKQVEISDTKSEWYGKTEKLIKGIFTSYTSLVETSEITPILLFNEVDGILKNRQSGSSNIKNTENTVVTILLNELENFSGILFMTSNNLDFDKSFNRRILFKVQFQEPTDIVRYNIIRDRLNILTDEEVRIISNNFKMTGGQIQNISKKMLMNQVLKGIPTFKEILDMCEGEFLEQSSKRTQIGFKIGSL